MFGSTDPLWIVYYPSSIGTLPAGWSRVSFTRDPASFTTVWQYADSGSNAGDQDLYNGDAAGLKRQV